MHHAQHATRRGMLRLTGAAVVLGLAGCTGADDQAGSGATSTQTPTETDHHGKNEGDHHDDADDHHEGEMDGNHNEEGGEHHDEAEGGHHDEESDDNGHNHDEGTPQEPSATAQVEMRTEGSEQHYAPHVVWIEPGGTVTWELESGSHDVTAYHPDNDRPLRIPEAANPWRTELLGDEGATVARTFETEGVYDYFCTPHEAVGMVGTVIVGDPDPHEQPGLEEPDSSLPEGARNELADLNAKVDEVLGDTH